VQSYLKSHQGFKRYAADTIVYLTLNYDLELNVSLVKHALGTKSHGTLNGAKSLQMSPTLPEIKSGHEIQSCNV